ncbi:MAG: M14 family metallopeptidase [Flavobacteriales bacterium]
MKKFSLLFFFLVGIGMCLNAQKKPSNYTPTYKKVVEWYDSVDKKHARAQFITIGKTNSGKPLHMFVISSEGLKTPASDSKRITVLINNGIHPGEPDGINASMQLCAEILNNEKKYAPWLEKMVICVVPVYNVDGALNRGCCSRANQNGPQEYGFRGNARNLDLNRDFIKMDSENAKSFARMFREWRPHILIDTHVSNGADYQYTFTYILSQKDKLSPVIQPVYDLFDKELGIAMKKKGHDIVPYVNTTENTPDKGINAFIESPRFATGYATLFNCFGITVETHMLKPFDQRVKATYDGLVSMLDISATHAENIYKTKTEADIHTSKLNDLALNYQIDTTRVKKIPFKGFLYSYPVSTVTGLPILKYDVSKPITWQIPFYENCTASHHVSKPKYYIIPQAWGEVIQRLAMNGVEMSALIKDSVINVNASYIDSIVYSKKPYEGHFYHNFIRLRDEEQQVAFNQGDFIIPMGKVTDRFVMEVLEPISEDSYFRWNFFDEILQQKEWFSDYVFEQKAEELLEKDPALKRAFEKRKNTDEDFMQDSWAQLYYIYTRSEYYEKSHNRYPVYRIEYKR